MSYQALYRKWRPDDFGNVKGQDNIVTTLRNQIKADRIGHAYLFCGTRGTGKTSVAKIFAKAVNCENPVDGSPCGKCPTCMSIQAGNSMNVIEIDAASNNGVESIRGIVEEVQYSPTEGKYKVYIIDEVHMLSTGAFNALLKTLEEPPSYVIFILATTEVAKIPITILSRCQRYDFHRISIDTIADRLSELMVSEGISVEDKAIRYVAKAADGSMRDALSLLDQCIAFYLGKELKYENVLDVLGAVDTEVFSKMLRIISSGNVSECMKLMEDIIIQGRDLTQFNNDLIWYLRNLLLVKTTDDVSKIEDVLEVSRDNLELLRKDAELLDVDTLMRFIRVLSDLSNELKFSTQKRIKFEITLVKLMKPAMDTSEDAGDLRSRITILESKLDEAFANIEKFEKQERTPVFIPAVEKSVEEPVKKREYDAVPEDIKEIAMQWNEIIQTLDDPGIQAFLISSNVTLGEDGNTLEIMVKSLSAFNSLSRPEVVDMLENFIEERTGLRVQIKVTKLGDDEDFNKKYIDLKELVGINIDVDDKEELI